MEPTVPQVALADDGLPSAESFRRSDNLRLSRKGLVKIADAEDELNLTKTGRGLGTPNYMAPEQFRDAKNADVRCDIYLQRTHNRENIARMTRRWWADFAQCA